MKDRRNFEIIILVFALLLFVGVVVYGMRVGNADIAKFGEQGFTLYSGALLLLLNHDLLSGNGNGANGKPANGSGTPDPTEK